MANFKTEIYLLVLFSSLVISSSQSHDLSPKNNHVALFILGDSLFDAGNNNYLNNTLIKANYFPYGETFFHYPTGRFSNGRIIPDFIAEYMKLPFISPYLQPGNDHYTDGVNFASAGAGALVETYQGMVIPLQSQVNYLEKVKKKLREKLGDAESEELVSKAIYLITFGSNDYVLPFVTNSTVLQQYSKPEYVDMVIGNLTIALKEIYKNGGRKFGMLSLGERLGCVPGLMALSYALNGTNGTCVEEINNLAKLHNIALSKMLKDLKRELKGFEYTNFHLTAVVSAVSNNLSKYGFKEGEEACCGSGPYRGIENCGVGEINEDYELCKNPDEYLFFDGSHPSDKFNNILSKSIWSGNTTFISPYNLKYLYEA